MEKKMNNEELQSRREFFKKAAKGALPILGMALLANVPSISKAADISMGCNNTCYRGCARICTGTCQTTCNRSCYHSHARRSSLIESTQN